MFNNEANNVLFNLTIKNMITVGNKKFAFVPVSLLFADFRFQRLTNKAKRKIANLAAHWNFNKMDPLRVSPHYEECLFSIIDGYHRFQAAIINGEEYLVCEIIELSEDVESRLIEEAILFATQGTEADPLTPIEKHKANCISGVWENIELQRLADKYKIEIDGNERSYHKENYLTGFKYALDRVRTDSATMDKVFFTLCSAGWNLSYNGFSNAALSMIFNILRLHKEDADKIVVFLSDYLRDIDPCIFFASATDKYPERKPTERYTLYLEDLIVDTLDIERVYNGGTVKIAA